MGLAHSHDGSSTEFGTATSNRTHPNSEIDDQENPNEASETWYGTPTQGEGVMDDNNVYVAVGMNSSSVDALVWTLKNIVVPSTVVHLVHVFPAVRRIPTPVGKLPRSQVATAWVESYLSQEREKKLAMLQKFLNLCAAYKVTVDTVLIESNYTEKAILRLIPVENIGKLVLGTTKSNIRKGRGKARHIQKNAPDFCKVKIICEGKEVTEQMNFSPSSPLDKGSGPFCCRCFSSMFT